MDVALNPPLAHLKLADRGKIFFALSHYVIECPYYARFYKRRSDMGKLVIIDNGTYERSLPLSPDKLIEAAKAIRAKEIIAPDVLRNPALTLELTRSFLSLLSDSERKWFHVMGVPQGRNRRDWIRQYLKIIQLDIDIIGIPKWLKRRDVVLKQLLRSHHFDRAKDHHLLGINDISELHRMPRRIIRSMDTKLPILLGMKLLSIKAKRPSEAGYFDLHLNNDQLKCILNNITEFKKICEDV